MLYFSFYNNIYLHIMFIYAHINYSGLKLSTNNLQQPEIKIPFSNIKENIRYEHL